MAKRMSKAQLSRTTKAAKKQKAQAQQSLSMRRQEAKIEAKILNLQKRNKPVLESHMKTLYKELRATRRAAARQDAAVYSEALAALDLDNEEKNQIIRWLHNHGMAVSSYSYREDILRYYNEVDMDEVREKINQRMINLEREEAMLDEDDDEAWAQMMAAKITGRK